MLADLRGDRESAKEHYRACKRAEGRISNRQAARQSEKYLDEPFTRTARR
jgi:hypothetical protein